MLRTLHAFLSRLATVEHMGKVLALARWVRSKGLTDVSIFLHSMNLKASFKVGDSSIIPIHSTEDIRFIICESRGFAAAREYVRPHLQTVEKWHRIFASFSFEIWEVEKSDSPAKLRWGLSEKERLHALSIVRMTAQKELCSERNATPLQEMGNPSEASSPKWQEPTTACVAVWINGVVRGSCIERKSTFLEALTKAATRVAWDNRYKPISSEELEHARFEITIMSDLLMPLTRSDLKQNLINPSQAYRVELGSKAAWYVPEVFNAKRFRRFRNLSDMSAKLADKADISKAHTPHAHFFTGDVIDFIENTARSKAHLIRGTAPVIAPCDTVALTEMATRCAHQLIRIQSEDGALTAVIDGHTGVVAKQFGWSQQSCAGWSLVFFGMTIRSEAVLQAGVRALQYFRRYIYDYPSVPVAHQVASLTYYGRAMELLGRQEEVTRAKDFIMNVSPEDLSYAPITFANLASFLGQVARGDRNVELRALHYAEMVQKDFDRQIKDNEGIRLARYPELIHAYYWFAQWKTIPPLAHNSQRMIEWFLKQQSEEGSFPSQSNQANISYPRGTGKVFEVLSLFYNAHSQPLDNAITWLGHMQYTDESAYFIPPQSRSVALGGLRHDYLNPEMWIDGSAHFLIGASRCVSAASNNDRLSPRPLT